MRMKKRVGVIVAAVLLSITSASALSLEDLGIDESILEEDTLITAYEIKSADTIEDGVKKIIGSVQNYGLNEYNEQVEDGVEQPYFWLLKPLNRKADNEVDMFAPDFTAGVNMGGCFEKHFHIHMQDGESVEDAQKHAKEDVPGCMENGGSPLGAFASKVRQMVLCQPKHGQLLLKEKENLHFAAAMPCHISIFKKDDKVYVAWRNVEKMAEGAEIDDDAQELAEEVQEAMVEMLGDL
ncbi:MAG: hypothetical protein B5M46_01075 [Epsilonproteobacteria bacterium 4484_20]|nr:MAG: hypothetical protein B5M46_01075 [Epsilonproteobacteria bacterium 4484_20]